MRFMVRSFVVAALAATLADAGAAQVHIRARDPLPVPDVLGFRTLKGDFHLHTVFSDGEVWPTIHVFEAWRDGLDVIALTDHVDYHPHRADVKVDGRRAHEIARPAAERLGVILIPGAEMTHVLDREHRALGPAHFNALFVSDPDALNAPDLLEALRRARAQNAFVFWNHPGRAPNLRWFPVIAAAHEAGLFSGVELVNGESFFHEAFPWIEEKQLTILANSDIHEPTPPRAAAGVRPLTLLFVRTADPDGIRDALEAGRTVAWMGGELWGAERYLRALWDAAVEIETPDVHVGPYLRLTNRSAIPFRFRLTGAPDWFGLEPGEVRPEGTSLLSIEGRPPDGAERVTLEFELTNLHVAPGRRLRVQVPLTVRP